jgi:hypothetical protein
MAAIAYGSIKIDAARFDTKPFHRFRQQNRNVRLLGHTS